MKFIDIFIDILKFIDIILFFVASFIVSLVFAFNTFFGEEEEKNK